MGKDQTQTKKKHRNTKHEILTSNSPDWNSPLSRETLSSPVLAPSFCQSLVTQFHGKKTKKISCTWVFYITKKWVKEILWIFMDFIHVLGASHLEYAETLKLSFSVGFFGTSQLHISPRSPPREDRTARFERNELVKLLKKGLFWRGSTLSHGCSCSCSSKSWCCCCGCGMIESLYCW